MSNDYVRLYNYFARLEYDEELTQRFTHFFDKFGTPASFEENIFDIFSSAFFSNVANSWNNSQRTSIHFFQHRLNIHLRLSYEIAIQLKTVKCQKLEHLEVGADKAWNLTRLFRDFDGVKGVLGHLDEVMRVGILDKKEDSVGEFQLLIPFYVELRIHLEITETLANEVLMHFHK